MTTIIVKTTTTDPAVLASSGGEAVHGESSSMAVAAIAGIQLDTTAGSTGAGVYGEARGGGAGVAGIQASSAGTGAGIYGEARGGGAAVVGRQTSLAGSGDGVYGECVGTGHALRGIQKNPTSTGAGLYAEHVAGLTAGFFRGNVVVTGDVSFPGADCAEEFPVQDGLLAEPGTVMALTDTGELIPSGSPYSNKVVGVVAGAGGVSSGIVMGRQQAPSGRRQPIALVGTVYCKVDAAEEPITVGALLTSAATPGHAMKATDPGRAFGAVIGKAMAPLHGGCGLIPILIALQ
ncbi:hypothetical protein OHT59_04540 [Streptomyces sp. NBC_00243]|uniref:hypothetical protein n=1 Tax=Streptomyces sp. NBC_00243 TaxID=2975688 RepID=UPI002DDAF226|nr:hypothetical protein [Streptomyces sp. NBC_00243]WRZ17804.1 hypothetical protein OHT59_04540 [Streptomyces sp. NBC_00243]